MSLLQGNTGTGWEHTVSPVLGGMSDLNIPYSNFNNHEQSSGTNFMDYGLMGYPSEAQRALLLSGVHQSAVGGLAPPGEHVLALKNLLQGNYMPLQGYPAGRRKGAGPTTGPAVNPLYKTELCRGWEETGSCRYGSKCQFAHGHQELRVIQRHRKYKTEACRTFAATGQCPYGSRCRFIHSFEEGGAVTNSSASHAVLAAQGDREAAEREAALGTLLSSLSIGGDSSASGLGSVASPTASAGGPTLSPLAPLRSTGAGIVLGAVHGPESPLGAMPGLSSLSLTAEEATNPLLNSLKGLASAPGTPTGATVATRAVHRAATAPEGAAPRRLPVFARIAEEEATR